MTERRPCYDDTMAYPLTNRKWQVVELAAHGHTDKAIARQLKISEHTVKHHWFNIRLKVQGRNKTHAVVLALTSRGDIKANDYY